MKRNLPRALILCPDARFGRLLENELIRLGLCPDVAPTLPVDVGSYVLLLVDTEAVILPDDCTLPAVLFGKASELPCGDGRLYLRRPFPLQALEDAVRRLTEDAPPPAAVSAPPLLTLHPDGKAYLAGQPLTLTPAEAAILGCLMEHRGSPVSRETLATLLGGGGNIVDVYVCKLRAKLEKTPGRRVIYTVRGVGYRLE